MLYQKLISSHSTWAKVTGAVLKKGWLLIPLAASVALTALNIPEGWQRVWGFVSLSLFAAIMISACNTLTDIFTLLRRESHITRCQIWILIAIGIWLVGAIIILDIQKDSKYGLVFGLVGSVLAWIFQDKIKGAAAFLHIRSHKLIAKRISINGCNDKRRHVLLQQFSELLLLKIDVILCILDQR